jgi:hypothetical protein
MSTFVGDSYDHNRQIRFERGQVRTTLRRRIRTACTRAQARATAVQSLHVVGIDFTWLYDTITLATIPSNNFLRSMGSNERYVCSGITRYYPSIDSNGYLRQSEIAGNLASTHTSVLSLFFIRFSKRKVQEYSRFKIAESRSTFEESGGRTSVRHAPRPCFSSLRYQPP